MPDRSLSLAAMQRPDVGRRVILADAGHLRTARDVAGGRRRVLPLEDVRHSGRAEAGASDIGPETRATIIYTSGTTGSPRGVVHTHRTLLAEAALAANPYRLSDADRVAPGVAGLARQHLHATWAARGRVVRVSVRRRRPWHRRSRLGPPARPAGASSSASPAAIGRTVFPHPRIVVLGGDTIYRQDIEAACGLFPNAIIGTGLASSEAGRVSYLFMDRATPLPAVVPLGYAVAGKRVRILREDGQDADPSEAGQIAVQSRHVAAGYWRQPDLTAARLAIVGPRGERLSLTGDLGRRLDDGCLVHLGRVDFQVKIRGYQVPLNAVEAALLELDGVREAAVVTHGSGPDERRLVAYVAPAPGGPEQLRRALSAALPAYMVPQVFVCRDALPRTGAGKVARGALPLPGRARPAVATPFAPPRDEIERLLAVVWATVLDLEEVGIDDQFLELGGDSLAAMRIAARVTEVARVEVPMSALLATATVAEMATVVREQLLAH